MPSTEGAATPWIWAGPIRAWAIDYERKGRGGRADPGVWVCCKEAAFLLPASSSATAATGAAAHADNWASGDGLLLSLAAETLNQCREHKDPKNALKLFNNIMSNAWARLPAEMTTRYGLKRESTVYERHVTMFLMEALQDAGYDAMAKRLADERKKHLEERKRIAARKAAAPTTKTAAGPLASAKMKRPFSSSGGGGGGAGEQQKRSRPLESAGGAAGRPAGKTEESKRAFAPPKTGEYEEYVLKPVKEPDDGEVAKAMVAALSKARAPLSLGQVALSVKDQFRGVAWNFARWLQAVKRSTAARPGWFVGHGDDMLGVGPEAGVEPPKGAPAPKPAPVAAPATGGAEEGSAEEGAAGDPAEGNAAGAVESSEPGGAEAADADGAAGGGNESSLADELFGDTSDL